MQCYAHHKLQTTRALYRYRLYDWERKRQVPGASQGCSNRTLIQLGWIDSCPLRVGADLRQAAITMFYNGDVEE